MNLGRRYDEPMTFQYRLRPAVRDAAAYVPGKPAAPIEGMTAYKLSANEHHMEPLPQVREAIAKASENPNIYPDPGVFELTEAMADFLGVAPKNVVFGAGGSEILAAAFAITAGPGANIVYPWPSFEMYRQVGVMSGAENRQIPLTADGRHDFDGLLGAIDDETTLVVLCSPNNPTGPAIREAEFRSFMDRVPSDLLVVLDQAYLEFITSEDTVDAVAALADYPNLIIMRTFSKAHGLAGLRVGYGIAHPDVILEMRKSIAPFSVQSIGQAAALASLRASAEVDVRAKEVAAARDKLTEELRALGIEVPTSDANYVWLPLGERSADFEKVCMAKGLAVRNLQTGIRVSIGPDDAMERFIAVTREFLGK